MSDGLNDSYGHSEETPTEEEREERSKLHINQETVFRITSAYVDILVTQNDAQDILTKPFNEYCFSGKDCLGCPIKHFKSSDCLHPFNYLKKELLTYVNTDLKLPEERKLQLILNYPKE